MGQYDEAKHPAEAIVLVKTAFAHDDPARTKKAIDHSSVARFQMYSALVMLDEGGVDEALNLLEAQVTPPYEF